MSKSTPELHRRIRQVLMDRLAQGDERRREAILEYFSVSLPNMERGAAEIVAANIPPLLPALYEKWIFLFAKRLFETAPEEQIQVLCDGRPENDAALILAYVMFLESERMERMIEEDLKKADLFPGADAESLAAMAGYVRGRMTEAARRAERERLDKAAAYAGNAKKRIH